MANRQLKGTVATQRKPPLPHRKHSILPGLLILKIDILLLCENFQYLKFWQLIQIYKLCSGHTKHVCGKHSGP